MTEPSLETPAVGAHDDREQILAALRDRGRLWPVVDLGGCTECLNPTWAKQVCSSCAAVKRRNPGALDTLEVVTMSSSYSGLGRRLADYKDYGPADLNRLREFAATLSSYLEAHREALDIAEGAVLLTVVPSSSNVIVDAIELSVSLGWSDLSIEHSGTAKDPSRKQRQQRADARMALSHADWEVDREIALGREVVLLDDLMTTGASLHSYASALKVAGATCVRGVALIRQTGGTYQKELRALAEQGKESIWSPHARRVKKLT